MTVLTTAPAAEATARPAAVLSVRGLRVRIGPTALLHGVDVEAAGGEVLAVLGPSGSGKTTLLRALTGLVPAPGVVTATTHRLGSGAAALDLAGGDLAAWRTARGRHIGVVHQDAALALTPLRRVGSLLEEVQALRGMGAGGERDRSRRAGATAGRRVEATAALRWAGFAEPEQVLGRRCCELSGGMAQRVGIALAAIGAPQLLLADEPTTAVDGLGRAAIVERLREYARAGGAVVLVTHDVYLAAAVADRVVVLDAGRVVDRGSAAEVLPRIAPAAIAGRGRPTGSRAEPATSTPPAESAVRVATERAAAVATAGPGEEPALRLRGIRKRFNGPGDVLTGVDLTVPRGELVGVVGRSGAGKSTLVRVVVGLEAADAGQVTVAGLEVGDAGWRRVRRAVQLVPQDPRASLNPWQRAWRVVAEPLAAHRIGDRADRRRRAEELLEQVGLAGLGMRRPSELSTGQCQRVSIARALAVRPELVVADEPVASLDRHLRADALALLRHVAAERRTAVVIVSHDLDALEAVCDRIVVLDAGRIVEDLPGHRLRADGTHPLTRALVQCYPSDPLAALRKDPPDDDPADDPGAHQTDG